MSHPASFFNMNPAIWSRLPILDSHFQTQESYMPGSFRYFLRRHVPIAFIALAGIAGAAGQAKASLVWTWSYSGPGISAAGTFITVDTPDASGFYLITGITGTRNGETITGLQPAGTPIPGNEPFDVDNLVRVGVNQLTGDGFGYSTSGGNFANPFFADFLPNPGYLEVFSVPPFTPALRTWDRRTASWGSPSRRLPFPNPKLLFCSLLVSDS
jgi:hypothetical protein